MSRKFIVGSWAVLCAVILMINITTAQDFTPIQYGQVVTGTIPSDDGQVVYTFSGNTGDIVTARAFSTTGGNLTVSLMNFSQQTLLTGSADPLNPLSPSNSFVYRLPETGTYYVVVAGAAGDFVLTLEARPLGTTTAIEIDTPVTLALPFADGLPSTFVFNTNPLISTTLHLEADPFNLNAIVEVRDGTGQIVTLFQGSVDDACVNMGPSDEIREVTVAATGQTTGTITVTLSNRNCELGDSPIPAPPPSIQPIPIDGVCAATSAGFVNIRSGPSTLYSIIGFMSPNQPLQVVGISDTGTWYVVQTPALQGWVAASVVGVTGPCTGLPVFATPPLPAASVTPGLPLFTATPIVNTATAGPTQTPVVVTATPEGTTEATPEVTPTEEVTAEPTAEVTPP